MKVCRRGYWKTEVCSFWESSETSQEPPRFPGEGTAEVKTAVKTAVGQPVGQSGLLPAGCLGCPQKPESQSPAAA